MRILYLIGGLICVGLGWLGLILPGLPATVFFIMAAACFSRSSPRLEQWVLNLPGVGRMVSDYRSGLGMPRKAKIWALSCIIGAVSLSVIFGLTNIWVRLGVIAFGAIGVWYVGWKVPTKTLNPAHNPV